MITAADTMAQARPFVTTMLDLERRRSGSKMTAYARVAGAVGVSASWVRKFVGRQPVALAAHEYLNIVEAYRALCERIEREADIERQRATHLRKQADAALESTVVPMARPPGPEESRS